MLPIVKSPRGLFLFLLIITGQCRNKNLLFVNKSIKTICYINFVNNIHHPLLFIHGVNKGGGNFSINPMIELHSALKEEIMAVVPLLPPGGFTVLARNLREARRQGQPRNMALPGTYYWFYQQVKNRGPWDYKQQNRALANFGNFNYGATGTAAGIPAEILLMGAGFAQSRAGTSRSEWSHWYQRPPYGDDPQDQYWIK